MRTLSAVRTRLRGTAMDAAARNARADHAGNGDAPAWVAGDRAAEVDEASPVSPMDPLLADPPASNGHGEHVVDAEVAETGFARPDEAPLYEATIVESPPEVIEAPTEPLVVPVVVPAAPGGETATPPAARPRPSRQRVRPSLPLLRRRPRVRKVTRIVRRIDAWGVFKISLVFYVILYIILLVAGVLLWNLANTTGTVANVEGFARDLFGLKTFEFDGEKLFRASWVLGAILVVAGTGLNVTLVVLFNLISDLMGGVRVTVLEEEVILRQRPVLPVQPEPPAADTPQELEPPGCPLPPPEAVDADAPPTSSV